jgi:hypothetical protein
MNLDVDPKQREPDNYPHLHSWVGAHAVKLMGKYHRSLSHEPSIPMGASIRLCAEENSPEIGAAARSWLRRLDIIAAKGNASHYRGSNTRFGIDDKLSAH